MRETLIPVDDDDDGECVVAKGLHGAGVQQVPTGCVPDTVSVGNLLSGNALCTASH